MLFRIMVKFSFHNCNCLEIFYIYPLVDQQSESCYGIIIVRREVAFFISVCVCVCVGGRRGDGGGGGVIPWRINQGLPGIYCGTIGIIAKLTPLSAYSHFHLHMGCPEVHRLQNISYGMQLHNMYTVKRVTGAVDERSVSFWTLAVAQSPKTRLY
jgi:hypothetical protein